MCGKKRLTALLLVLLVAASLLWAFPGRKDKALEIQEEAQQAVLEEQAPTVETAEEQLQEEALEEQQPQMLSETDSEEESTKLSELLESLETQRKMDSRQLTALIEALNDIKADYDIVMTDAEEKQAIIDELSAANAKQADDLAYLRGRYDRAVASKFFANTGLALGFKGNTSTYGVTGSFGMRLGAGLMVGAGAQVMAGSFTEAPFSNWSLDDLSIQMTVGWEW